jgi:hypothetical protein
MAEIHIVYMELASQGQAARLKVLTVTPYGDHPVYVRVEGDSPVAFKTLGMETDIQDGKEIVTIPVGVHTAVMEITAARSIEIGWERWRRISLFADGRDEEGTIVVIAQIEIHYSVSTTPA